VRPSPRPSSSLRYPLVQASPPPLPPSPHMHSLLHMCGVRRVSLLLLLLLVNGMASAGCCCCIVPGGPLSHLLLLLLTANADWGVGDTRRGGRHGGATCECARQLGGAFCRLCGLPGRGMGSRPSPARYASAPQCRSGAWPPLSSLWGGGGGGTHLNRTPCAGTAQGSTVLRAQGGDGLGVHFLLGSYRYTQHTHIHIFPPAITLCIVGRGLTACADAWLVDALRVVPHEGRTLDQVCM
jgi:hypothetical protein